MLVHYKNNNDPVTHIHVPKTAGSAVWKWFEASYDWYDCTPKQGHYTYDEAKQVLKDDEGIDNMGWCFCSTRNPFDRVVSGYAYLRWRHEHKAINTVSVRTQRENLQYLFSDFETYVANIERFLDPVYEVNMPQVDFATKCDYVMRMENLQEDFKVIQERLGNDRPLGITNWMPRNDDWKAYYTDKSRDKIEQVFKEDFTAFDYSWNDPILYMGREKWMAELLKQS